MNFLCSICAVALLVAVGSCMTQREIIEIVNSNPASTWRAGINFNGRDPSTLKHLMGVIRGPIEDDRDLSNGYETPYVEDLPENFDSRDNWPDCPTINDVRDQSDCGSCWAFGTVEAISDRLCIFNNEIVRISAEDLMTCCKGLFSCGFGCGGGQPKAAWKYYVTHGIVTGGLYNDTTTCQPYAFPPCAHHVNSTDLPQCGEKTYKTPACESECISEYTTNTYTKDKHYGETHYTIVRDANKTQSEIVMNGPVTADFDVYEDFLSYTSGVYQHTTGALLGGHAIKIIGYGVEDGTPYWLCTNSWNAEWGDKGFFKILRGSNECGIENDINAGKPKGLNTNEM